MARPAFDNKNVGTDKVVTLLGRRPGRELTRAELSLISVRNREGQRGPEANHGDRGGGKTKVYGSADPPLTYTGSAGALKNPATASAATST